MSTHSRRISKYELLELLGRGPVTETWKAADTQQNRNVAIKLFHPDLHADPDFVARFLTEAQLIASLHHANIVQMLDFQVSQPPEAENLTPYVVMNYIEGQTLASFIMNTSRMGRFPPGTEVIRLLLPISAAIDYAHQRGVIHHDIKPSNILLGKAAPASASTPMLTDFGLVQPLKAANCSLSSALYISPEQVQGYVDNNRSDLYSLGMILYELFTGTLPFDGDDPNDIMMQHLSAVPTAPSLINPNILPAVTAVIMRSIAKDPTARYPSANAMIGSLSRALNISQTEKLGQPYPIDAMNIPTYIMNAQIPGMTPSSSPAPALPPGGSLPSSPSATPVPSAISGSGRDASPASMTPQLQVTPPDTIAGALPFVQPAMDHAKLTPLLPNAVAQTPALITAASPARAPKRSAPDLPALVPVELPSAVLPRKRRRGLFIALIALLIVVLIGSGVGTYFVFFPRGHTTGNTPPAIPIVGHTFFISSGLISTNPESNQGITDQLQVNMEKIPPPQSGKSYYAWLLSVSQADWKPISLGKLAFNPDGTASLTYAGDAEHTDLLANNSRFLITEEDAGTPPPSPSLDQSTRRYYAEFSQKPGLQDPKKYSLYDHIQHLLAADPKLKDAGLNGGLDIWLFRNTEKIVEWSGSARDAWNSKSAAGADLIRRQLSRILAYLDGTTYYHIELPGESLRVDPTIAKVALLEFDVEKQDPPGYLYHIGTRHLHALIQLPDASPDQKELAVRISKAIDNVNVWLQTVHNDALKLFKMTNGQLFGDDGRLLLDELATQANYAFVGQINPYTSQVKEGVVQVHYNIQRLATFEIRECTSSHPCAL
jgi:serine/threonine protein kinase